MERQSTSFGRESTVYCKLCDEDISIFIPNAEVAEEYVENVWKR